LSACLSARGARYHLRGRALVAAVSLDLALGGVTIIVGPNGAGQSTLLRLLSEELSPALGEVLCDGVEVRRVAPWLLACKRAVMTQAHHYLSLHRLRSRAARA
jgi:iron complex transport system ATP-binding protein